MYYKCLLVSPDRNPSSQGCSESRVSSSVATALVTYGFFNLHLKACRRRKRDKGCLMPVAHKLDGLSGE